MTPTTRDKSKRACERITVALPVRLYGADGQTRNVSAVGILLEMESATNTGSDIAFDIELGTAQNRVTATCQGRVVRTERKGERQQIAVALTDIVMLVHDNTASGLPGNQRVGH